MGVSARAFGACEKHHRELGMSGSRDEDLIAHAKFLDVNGVKIELATSGKGPPLLFLHGMDGVEGATGLIRLLAENFEVFAPSHPGFGGSELPTAFSTVDDLSYFYLDLMDELGLRSAVVAGFSFGGWIAAEMLVKDSSRASKLVLGAPFGLPTADRRQARVADIFMIDPRELTARMQVTPEKKRDQGGDAALERSVRNADSVSLFGWSPYMHNPKLPQRLHRLKAPTLVIWGEQDAIAPAEYGKAYAAALPNASFKTIPKCGHRIYVDRPDAAAQNIRKFAETTASAAV